MSAIILVHGAYADSSSWNGVIPALLAEGHDVTGFAVPLRSVASDAALLADLVRSAKGPVVLAGHSYGGAVMTALDVPEGTVSSIVYVAAFALAPGENAAAASSLVPGSTLGDTQITVPLQDGGTDTYIAKDKYHHQFAADLDEDEATLMSVTQRPITAGALGESLGSKALWQRVPSRFIFGDQDLNIPVGAHRIMAERAGSRRTVEVAGASHVVGISHPSETAQLILEAGADS